MNNLNEISELRKAPAKFEYASLLTRKYGVTFECLVDILNYLSLEQVDSLLRAVTEAAQDEKKSAYAALPGVVAALEKIKPDAENTVSVLCKIAKIAGKETGKSFESLSSPEQAQALQNTLDYNLAGFLE